MKVEIKNDRKGPIKAVVDSLGTGIFIQKNGGGILYLSGNGLSTCPELSLKQIVAQSPDRTPLYAGDEITIKF